MSDRRYNRGRTTNGRYFHIDSDNDDIEANDRYKSKGPLGPLRSPVNREKKEIKRNNRTDKRNSSSTMNNNFGIKEYEFPPLGNTQQTPEIGRIKHNSSSLDWAAQVETFEKLSEEENENLKRYRRRLEMGNDRKPKVMVEMEEDSTVLLRRQKAIDYGKNTPGYDVYLRHVKRTQRRIGNPRTPNKYIKASRRSWDMQVKLWKRALHQFDPPATEETKSADVSMTDVSSEFSSSVNKHDSDISDNGSDLLDYRDNQENENFSHNMSGDERENSSIKDTSSLDSNYWINPCAI